MQMPYFNRNGDMVVSVDSVQEWLKAKAAQQADPGAFIFVQEMADNWAEDINMLVVQTMEARDK